MTEANRLLIVLCSVCLFGCAGTPKQSPGGGGTGGLGEIGNDRIPRNDSLGVLCTRPQPDKFITADSIGANIALNVFKLKVATGNAGFDRRRTVETIRPSVPFLQSYVTVHYTLCVDRAQNLLTAAEYGHLIEILVSSFIVPPAPGSTVPEQTKTPARRDTTVTSTSGPYWSFDGSGYSVRIPEGKRLHMRVEFVATNQRESRVRIVGADGTTVVRTVASTDEGYSTDNKNYYDTVPETGQEVPRRIWDLFPFNNPKEAHNGAIRGKVVPEYKNDRGEWVAYDRYLGPEGGGTDGVWHPRMNFSDAQTEKWGVVVEFQLHEAD